MIKPMIKSGKHDEALPKADTCFFNIELPDYSKKEIAKERIMLAINLDCVSINADNIRTDDNPLMDEIEQFRDYDEGEEDEPYEEE